MILGCAWRDLERPYAWLCNNLAMELHCLNFLEKYQKYFTKIILDTMLIDYLTIETSFYEKKFQDFEKIHKNLCPKIDHLTIASTHMTGPLYINVCSPTAYTHIG